MGLVMDWVRFRLEITLMIRITGRDGATLQDTVRGCPMGNVGGTEPHGECGGYGGQGAAPPMSRMPSQPAQCGAARVNLLSAPLPQPQLNMALAEYTRSGGITNASEARLLLEQGVNLGAIIS